jgi:hypothetical protein
MNDVSVSNDHFSHKNLIKRLNSKKTEDKDRQRDIETKWRKRDRTHRETGIETSR